MGTYYRKFGTLAVPDTTKVVSKAVGIPPGVVPSSLGFYVKVVADPRDVTAIRKWRRMAAGYESAILQVSRGPANQDEPPSASPPNGWPLLCEALIDPWAAGGWQAVGATSWWNYNAGEPTSLIGVSEYYYNLWTTRGLHGISIATCVEWWLP